MHCGFNRVFILLPLLAHKAQILDEKRLMGRERESFCCGICLAKLSNIFLSFILSVFFIEHYREIAADWFFHSSPKLKCFGAKSSMPAKLHN